jgi:hypothetical protein
MIIFLLSRRLRYAIAASIGLTVAAQAARAAQATLPLIQSVIVDDAILSRHRSLGPSVGILLLAGLMSFIANCSHRS